MANRKAHGLAAALLTAWVLWQEKKLLTSPIGEETTEWEIHGAWETKRECEGTKERVFKVLSNPEISKGAGVKSFEAVPNELVTLLFKAGGLSTRRLICLPDTVDPRGRQK